MREFRTSGSVRGAARKGGPYRHPLFKAKLEMTQVLG